MNGSYSLSLVAVSVVIAIVASYTAPDLANRVSDSAAKSALLAESLQRAKDAADAALRENREITAEIVAVQSKLLISARQIVVNLITNAKQATDSVAGNCREIIIRVAAENIAAQRLHRSAQRHGFRNDCYDSSPCRGPARDARV
jgi:hypothetical protein